MTTPVPPLTDIPAFPALADRATGTYNSKAYAFGTHMSDVFNSEILALANNVLDNADAAAASATLAGEKVTEASGFADAAQASANDAADSVLAAGGKVTEAQAARDQAQTYAAAAQSAAGVPALVGNGTKVLGVKSDETGVEWVEKPAALGPRNWNVAQYTASTTFVVPADTYVIRPYAFGKGGDATSTASGGGGGCAYGDIAVTPGTSVTLSISAGVAKVTISGVDLLIANPASGVTAGTASKHASVTNGGAYSGGAGLTAASAGGASSGSPLGAGFAGAAAGAAAGWGGQGGGGGGGGVGNGGSVSGAGDGLAVPSSDPLLRDLTGLGPFVVSATGGPGMNGGPGAGGGASGSARGGRGGFGGGGGSGGTASPGGDGGFGGGGGGGGTTGTGGNGGFGGGGGKSNSGSTHGTGGPAVIRIYY